MKWLGLVGLMVLAANQAAALSCIPPDPVAAYQKAAAAPDTYYVLYGAFAFDTKAAPKGTDGMAEPAKQAPISAMFRGNGLSKTGFNLRFDQMITIQPVCVGPWCGAVSPHTPALAFVRADGDQLIAEVGPCGGHIFLNPSQGDLDNIVQCINGNCPSTQPLQ